MSMEGFPVVQCRKLCAPQKIVRAEVTPSFGAHSLALFGDFFDARTVAFSGGVVIVFNLISWCARKKQ